MGGEKLGSREQVLETRVALPEVWHEIGGQPPSFSSVATGDLEYSRAQPVRDLLVLEGLVTLGDSAAVSELADSTNDSVSNRLVVEQLVPEFGDGIGIDCEVGGW
ncbi:hypothetical protein [Natronococcus roseus]|uniref:hypothetical protein n=1 Tax=Natronococcus roseus TaxID=1052014 RepID=UPI00374CB627